MDISKIPPGSNPPEEINVVIEVPLRSEPIKYEFDKDSGAIFVDRYLYTTMFYPCNYGFVPNTLSEDGDPIDVMVVGRMPLLPGSVLRARPIGVLMMEDEAGQDEKLLAVPIPKISLLYQKVLSYQDIPEIDLQRLAHFFEHYMDLEPDKRVKIRGWAGPEEAHRLVREGIARAAGG
jgi:inorganic pyrophosphatase